MDSHEGIALWQSSISKSQTRLDAGRVPCPLFGLPGPPEPTLKKPWGNRELEPIAPTRPWRRYQSEGPTERSQRPQGTRSNLVPPPTSIATCALSTWSTTLPPLLTRLYYHFDLYSIDHPTTLSFLLVWRLSNWCKAVFVDCLPIPQLHHTEHERKLLKSIQESAYPKSGVSRGIKKLMRLYKVCFTECCQSNHRSTCGLFETPHRDVRRVFLLCIACATKCRPHKLEPRSLPHTRHIVSL